MRGRLLLTFFSLALSSLALKRCHVVLICVFIVIKKLEKSILGRKSTVKSHRPFQRPNKRYCLEQANDVEIGDEFARVLVWKTLYYFNRGNLFFKLY